VDGFVRAEDQTAAIAQRIHLLSADEVRVEEGSLYPALQKLLVKG
jgi:DNA-binding PadR family transcriptional regulator